jgi:hypothetical protein
MKKPFSRCAGLPPPVTDRAPQLAADESHRLRSQGSQRRAKFRGSEDLDRVAHDFECAELPNIARSSGCQSRIEDHYPRAEPRSAKNLLLGCCRIGHTGHMSELRSGERCRHRYLWRRLEPGDEQRVVCNIAEVSCRLET